MRSTQLNIYVLYAHLSFIQFYVSKNNHHAQTRSKNAFHLRLSRGILSRSSDLYDSRQYPYPGPLHTNSMTEDLLCQLTKKPSLIRLRQLLKHCKDALPPRIPNSTQPIPRHRTRQQARKVRHNKPHSPTTQPAHHAPELPRRRPSILRHALLPQHLLKHVSELLVAELLLLFPVLRLAAEAEAAPGEAARDAASCRGLGIGVGDLFVRVPRCGGCGGAGAEAVVDAGGVVVAAAGWVGECVIGVVYDLEFARPFGAFWGVGGDAVGVGFQGCSERVLSR